jgi:hypothetical protein
VSFRTTLPRPLKQLAARGTQVQCELARARFFYQLYTYSQLVPQPG